ncbi:MAG: FAD-dependent oxidoreductase [Clostridia bacterium]|nr:FAD-dependent oxidoreductase [Clostridia bacterium]
MKTYTIPQKELEVRYSADVVVCGGGTAGVSAARAAADQGCSVIVIEQFGSTGGTSTNGLVTPYMHSGIAGDPDCSYTRKLIAAKMREMGGMEEDGRAFDPMVLRVAGEQLLLEAGVKILYYHFISEVIAKDGVVKGVVCVTKSGSYVIEGREFIDCTGDADVSVLAGAEYTKGNPETGKCQPISLRYIVSGIDKHAFGEFIRSEAARTGIDRGTSYDGKDHVYAAVTGTGDWTLNDAFDKALAAGDLDVEDKLYWQVFTVPGRKDALAFNNPEFFEDVDGTNVEDLTKAQLEGKRRIYRQLEFYKKYLKGFENAYISEIAPMVGVRESRNVIGKYTMTGIEMLQRKKFADSFSQTNYPIDIHGKELNCKENVAPVDDGKPWYEIPFGTLVVKDFKNLFVAGRCIGVDFLAESSIRVQSSVRSSGDAAGIGAALACKRGVSSYDIDGVEVRNIMISLGADFK